MTGASLLDELRAAFSRYVVLPSDQALDAITLWVAASHCLPAFQFAPRLVIRSPEKRCGKSRLLDIIDATCSDPLVTVNATPAAIFRRIGDGNPPTLLIDEADAIWGTRKQAESNEDLRALVNAGHQRGRPALRCVGPNQTPTEFATFAMVALAGIGDMPDTITDRAVTITMRRRAPHERVETFRHRRDALPLHELRQALAEWGASVLHRLEDAEPDMPVEDRAADTWEPLVAVADEAGGRWPTRARTAALKLVSEANDEDTEASLGVRLLDDVRRVFAALDGPALASVDLVNELRALVESPWGAFDLDQRNLARRLRQYGITSKQVRPGGGGRDEKQVRGYVRADFADAFSRYLPGEASASVTPSHSQVTTAEYEPGLTHTSVTRDGTDTSTQASDQHQRTACDGVTDVDAMCAACGTAMRRTVPWQTKHPSCEADVRSA